MAEQHIFDDLLEAIQSSIIQAQSLSQHQYLTLLKEYFDKDNKPIMVEMKVPSYNPQSSSEDDSSKDGFETIYVPRICLVPLSSLRIKELDIKFQVQFAELIKGGEQKAGHSLFARLPFGKVENHMADVEIKFEGTEPPEGVLRINQHLVKFLP
jgi:hypothetical protein